MKKNVCRLLFVLIGFVPLQAMALLESCTVAAVPVAFGSYNPLSASPLSSTGTVTVTCTAIISLAVSYTIKLSQGGAGSYAPRKMAFSSNNLNYNLYTSNSYGVVWGDGTGGTSFVSDSYALALLINVVNYSVYGSVPALQNIPAGAYSDLITVTVNY